MLRFFCFVLCLAIYGCNPASTPERKAGLSQIRKTMITKKLRPTFTGLPTRDGVLPKINKAVKKAIETDDVEVLARLIKKGGKIRDEATLAYYLWFKNKHGELLDSIAYYRNEINKTYNLENKYASIIDKEESINANTKFLTENIRVLSSLIETRALLFSELLETIGEGTDNKFELAFELCCRSATLTEDLNVKTRSTFRDIFKSEYGHISKEMERVSSIKTSTEDVFENAILIRKPASDSHRFSVKIRYDFIDMGMARTELSKNLKYFRDILWSAIKIESPK